VTSADPRGRSPAPQTSRHLSADATVGRAITQIAGMHAEGAAIDAEI
jgi:hypothetical protein